MTRYYVLSEYFEADGQFFCQGELSVAIIETGVIAMTLIIVRNANYTPVDKKRSGSGKRVSKPMPSN